MVEDQVDSIQIGGAGAVAGEDGRGECALQRSEAEHGVAIAAQDESDKVVAECANAVVKEDGVWHGTKKTLAACAAEGSTPPGLLRASSDSRNGAGSYMGPSRRSFRRRLSTQGSG